MTLSLHHKVQHQLLDFLKYYTNRRDFISALKVYQTLIPLYHVYGDAVLLPQILGLLRRASEAYDESHVDIREPESEFELGQESNGHKHSHGSSGEEAEGDENDQAVEERSNAFMRFLQQLFAVDTHHRKELLLEMICYDIKWKKYQEGYDYLVNYLALRPFADEPIFHGMAGLLASFLFYSKTSLSLTTSERVDWDSLPVSQSTQGLALKAMDHFKKYFELPSLESHLGGSRHQSMFRYYYDGLLRLSASSQKETSRHVSRKRPIRTRNKK